jgi:uncharacterized membrane protein required for colicin V production
MSIWILAVLLLASLAGLGYRQGAIRVAFSLAGIVLGALLAVPLAMLIRPGLAATGIKNPILLWLLGPGLVFLVVLIIFKIAGLAVHNKIAVYYKYQTGDLQPVLWERMNRRLGLCLGLVNGAAYLVLISLPVYMLSYWTFQIATPESDPGVVKLLNRLGEDLESTGMERVAGTLDKTPAAYYDAADIAGLIYHNPLLQARVSRYPALLSLAERPEFQDLADDMQFTEMQMKQVPIMELIKYPKMQAILNNPDTLKAVSDTLAPDLKDLRTFLETGMSPKYSSEKILGRWDFDVNGTLALLRKTRPNIPFVEMQKLKKGLALRYAKTSFIAAADQQVFLKSFPHLKGAADATPSAELGSWQGQWKNSDGKYELALSMDGKEEAMTAAIEGDRLTLTGPGMELAFVRED